MEEFKVYDEMMAEYYGSNCDLLLPLNSWEFYSEYNNKLSFFRDDLSVLQKLSENWDFRKNYQEELLIKNKVIIVTNPKIEIVYISHNIKNMNGFTQEEVIGNSPKMFQGKDTCTETTKKVRDAISREIPFEVSILNYRKDKSEYYCNIKGFPLKNLKGKLINYIAFEEAA